MSSFPFTYKSDATVLIMGVGVMGQHMASNVLNWFDVNKLVIADHAETILVGTDRMKLTDFAASVSASQNGSTDVIAETVDVTSEEQVKSLLERHGKVDYLMHTAGIAPSPLTPPEQLTKEAIMRAYEVNLWGAHNVIKQGVNSGNLRSARGVIILSTSATVGAEGRSSSAYEESKGGLLNLVTLQSRYYVEEYGLVLNGLAPSPLRGPMAEQHPVSAGRLKAVEESTPMGGLTEPKHISAATMFFWADECWCAGEVLTTDGGYTKHKPIFGPLPGAS
jgi:NAD(P)-dependent dehydrogenase (short-subunit alcohol dehydrogenase family)